jgi:hypothetical protein
LVASCNLHVLCTHLPGGSPGHFICGSLVVLPYHGPYRDTVWSEAPILDRPLGSGLVSSSYLALWTCAAGSLVHHPAPMTDCVRSGPVWCVLSVLLSISCSSATVVPRRLLRRHDQGAAHPSPSPDNLILIQRGPRSAVWMLLIVGGNSPLASEKSWIASLSANGSWSSPSKDTLGVQLGCPPVYQ